jgi:hypothetical protein
MAISIHVALMMLCDTIRRKYPQSFTDKRNYVCLGEIAPPDWPEANSFAKAVWRLDKSGLVRIGRLVCSRSVLSRRDGREFKISVRIEGWMHWVFNRDIFTYERRPLPEAGQQVFREKPAGGRRAPDGLSASQDAPYAGHSPRRWACGR